ncbi:HEXXH motif domain-containing protein [Streptomyces spinoverrucosus]|uniref:HEXXH motif domain-containing protein n=1 Tax=Streptomyces spinoverrucosus TaxID=284043 RepID=A0A4Y3VPB8_9ACTN|nr:HEXXH motif domain-containing protein [Streptomyces spinoverrucosus]GEC07621.1 HEXXH motif domain-containing protein [Streptomyces spinoverrucosus]GHB61936.1 HEXXH motif domain-containing protein [Streptomyces spinoverrucosus]
MAADATTTGDHLPFHRLPAADVEALARGEGDDAVVRALLGAERSRRLLLLRALDNALTRNEATSLVHADAWALLERAQRAAPDVFEDVLMSPSTGMWVSLAVRAARGRAPGEEQAPSWVVTGYLSALAAAAAARAGVDFSITVPVRHGMVLLPTLGCAVLPERQPWSTARVTGHAGRLRITGAGEDVEVVSGREVRGPSWLPVRRLTLGAGGAVKHLVLEELDPYRTFPRPSEPRPMPEAEAASWSALLADAWEIVRRDDPVTAGAMRRGLMSVAPTPVRERFRPYSCTASAAFGGVVASRPDDAVQLAATLVHEFQHIKLGALINLGPLTEPPHGPDAPEELFYAPWRDDPRPLGGLLQGIYAFLGVARFWRAHRHTADPAYVSPAHFEFALWRGQVWSVLNEVHGHAMLTPLGRYLLERLRERCARWMTEEVPAEELRLAEWVAADHRSRWRAHHLHPPAEAVEEAVRDWRHGAARPPSALAAVPALVPDSEVRFLDTAAVLARHHLTDPEGAVRTPPVEGADPADALLIAGRHEAAREAYAARLSGKEAPVSAWAGLGRALSPDPSHEVAARLLLNHPERARAVQDALLTTTGHAADPVRLAQWLGQDLAD